MSSREHLSPISDEAAGLFRYIGMLANISNVIVVWDRFFCAYGCSLLQILLYSANSCRPKLVPFLPRSCVSSMLSLHQWCARLEIIDSQNIMLWEASYSHFFSHLQLFWAPYDGHSTKLTELLGSWTNRTFRWTDTCADRRNLFWVWIYALAYVFLAR